MARATRAVIGTAGHVDHGKTTLVRELTGIDTDRLPEEKARGISIELGFAWLESERGRIAFVDVPGHERFVRQMIAGAAGVDAVMLVVAADEGVMPQTREHLDICALLGIELGLVALTKVDLVDADWLALASDDIVAATRGSFLEGRPIVPFAAGDERLRSGLAAAVLALADEVDARRARDLRARRDRPFALPVDRVFTSPGFGTIVTGTTQCGELAVGDDVVFHPGGATTRVRGLEVHGERADEVGPGVRAAVNAPDLDLASTARSGLLVHADGPVPTSMIDATFIPIARLPEPIADGEKGLVHLGTARVEATLALLDPIPAAGAPPPAAGSPRAAQLRLAEPLAFVPGAAYVFRGFRTWPGRPDLGLTLGGGRALAPSARRQRTGPTSADQVRALAGPPEAGLLAWVEAHGEAGAARASLAGSLPWPRATIDRVVADAVTAGTAHVTVTTVVARAALVHLERAVLRALDDYHRERPTRPGLRLDELRTRARPSAAPDLFEQVVARLVAAGQLAQVGDALAAAGFAATAAADDALQAAIVERLDEADLSPPKLAELGPSLPGSPSAALLAEAAVALVAAGRLVRAGPDLLFAASALARFEARVRAHFATAEWMDAQALKELAGASRKFAIPLGEWLDKARVTVRVGDRRRLRG